ncbi:hypothetical protein PG987_001987 [Apiospora arundinis]
MSSPQNPFGGADDNGESGAPIEFPRFGQLPMELLQIVFNHAGPVDQALLAATCRDLTTIGGVNMSDIWNEERLAWEFLLRVEQDANPRLVPCRSCLSLHSPQVCLPSWMGGTSLASYKCRTAAFQGHYGGLMMSRPHYLLRRAPALYGLAKYRRQGLDTAWFPEADKEEVYLDQIHFRANGNLTCMVENKVDVNDDGVFWRQRHDIPWRSWIGASGVILDEIEPRHDWMYQFLACRCGKTAPRFTLVDGGGRGAAPAVAVRLGLYEHWSGGDLCGSPLSADDSLYPDMLPGGFRIATGPGATVTGPIVGCEKCSTDMQAEVRFGPINGPGLTVTTWTRIGEASSMTALRDALYSMLRNVTEEPRLPGPFGQVAALSGML